MRRRSLRATAMISALLISCWGGRAEGVSWASAGGPAGCLAARAGAASAHSAAMPAASTVGPAADFDGDGNGDIAIGVPGEDIGSISNAGGVNVLYGDCILGAAGNQFWSQNSAGILGAAETNDHVGSAVSVGDFNGDGYTDLAVGVPFEDLGSTADAGAVNVLYGSPAGLTATGNQLFDETSAGIAGPGTAGAGDEFGAALATGDFNNDGYLDLAVGSPGQPVGTSADAGAVTVLYGSPHGLVTEGSQFIHGARANDGFGSALAAGNFDGQSGDDLGVGAPGASDDGQAHAGRVSWILGGPAGLTAVHTAEDFDPEPGSRCGSSLVSLNWDTPAVPDGDLVAGCPDATVDGVADAGVAELFDGTADGLTDGVTGFTSSAVQRGAEFGSALAAAPLLNSHNDMLVVAAPRFDIGAATDAGRVEELKRDGIGIKRTILEEGYHHSPGSPAAGDEFGASVTTASFNAAGVADLAVGVPGKRIGSMPGAGEIISFSYGFAGDGAIWDQNSPGILGAAESEDMFGAAISARQG